MNAFVAFIVCLVLSTTSCSGLLWDGLRTTFALDAPTYLIPIHESTGYKSVPRTVQEAGSSWIPVSQTCSNNGLFNGLRYVQVRNSTFTDYSVSALYDINGVIAGIQMNIKESEAKANPENDFEFDEIPMFVKNMYNGESYYTLTAYFVDPTTICSEGRQPSMLRSQGTGAAVYFQNGTSPLNFFLAPMKRQEALDNGWSDNNCFPGMGVHNWYRQEEFQNHNCRKILPVFLLYTKHGSELLGFGFQHVGISKAPRFEQPSTTAVKLIVGERISPCHVEKADKIGVTTFHVYLIDNPLRETCVI